LREFIKKNWLGILGLVIGVIGLAASFYFFNESKKNREPIFVVDPVRTEILSTRRVSDAPIRILKNDGTEITSDLNSIRFYFWNRGSESIKRANVLQAIKVTLEDPRGSIIAYKLLKRSRDITELRILPETINSRSLIIDFAILENNDGGTGQIIYEGKPEAQFTISGIIESVKRIETADYLIGSPSFMDYLKSLRFIGVLVLTIVLLGAILLLGKWIGGILSSIISEGLRKKIGKSFPYLIIFFGILLYSYLLVVQPLTETKKNVRENLGKLPPASILP
jgi:hypothetical protein